jgi:uncharacterized protein YkwD
MKKLFLVFSVAVSSFGFSQVKLTRDHLIKIDSIVKSEINFTSIETELVVLINAYRLSLNLDTLLYNSSIQAAAKFQLDYCVSINKLTHDNEGNLQGILERADKISGSYSVAAGEVLAGMLLHYAVAYNQSIAQYIFNQWKTSPGHNAIITSPKMKTIGISVSRVAPGSAGIWAAAVVNSFKG